jgi:2'-5' RNA ligase
MEKIRAFIAIELPEEVKADLSSVQSRLRPERHPYVKWVSVDGVHLTLKFLGNIDQEKVSPIAEAMAGAAQKASPFRLEVGGLGAFPNLRSPRVVWVAVEGEVEKLASLQRAIDHSLVALGFSPETRSFTPHLTLGRLKERASAEERRRMGEALLAVAGEEVVPFRVTEISLMRSTLTPRGAIYNRICSIQFESGLPITNF